MMTVKIFLSLFINFKQKINKMEYNSKYLGPGYWASWHIKSIYSDTESKKGEVARNIALDIKNFPCLKCQDHAKYYVSQHPLIKAVKDKDPLSMFKWIVDFHNEVNLRLKKEVYSYEEALSKWNGSNFCKENCDDEEKEEKEEEEVEEEVVNSVSMLIRNY